MSVYSRPLSSLPSMVLPSPHQSRIAGRVRNHFLQWKKIAGPWHSKVIKEGIPRQWVGDPSPRIAPSTQCLLCTAAPRSSKSAARLSHYLEIGSVVPLANQDDTSGVCSTFFPVAKKGTDKLRGCIDLWTINLSLRYEHFKMEGTHIVAQILRRRDWMSKIDLSDFYMHLCIAE